MARPNITSNTDKAKLLRALAFEVHRKRPADEVMNAYLDDQMRSGKHREFRAAQDALNESGFAAALHTLNLVSDDGAVVLKCLIEGGDHRLQSNALTALAEFLEG